MKLSRKMSTRCRLKLCFTGASTSRVTGGPAEGDWGAKLGAEAVERDFGQRGGGGSTAACSFAGGPA